MYYLIASILRIVIAAVQLLLVARLILSFAPLYLPESAVSFIFRCTEPVLKPAKTFIRRYPRLYHLPFDLSVPITFLVLGLIAYIL